MGKRGSGWFSSVKRVFRSPSKGLTSHKKKVDGNGKTQPEVPEVVASEDQSSPEVSINGKITRSTPPTNHTIAVRPVTTPTKVVRFAGYNHFSSKEDRAAVTVQSCYRGYLARRALRALKALVKVQALVRGHNVRKQAQLTMHCMQSLLRVQARVRAHKLFVAREKIRSYSLDEEQERRINNVIERRKKILEHDALNSVTLDDRRQIREIVNGNGSKMRDNVTKGRKSVSSSSYHHQEKQIIGSKDSVSSFGRSQKDWLNGWTPTHDKYRNHDLCSDEETFATFATTFTDETSEKTVDLGIADPSRAAGNISLGRLSPSHRKTGSIIHRQLNSDNHIPSYMAPTQSAKAKVRWLDTPMNQLSQQLSLPQPPWNLSIKRGSHRVETGGDWSSFGRRTSYQDQRSPTPTRNHGVRGGLPGQSMDCRQSENWKFPHSYAY